MVRRRYTVYVAESVRRYETVVVETDHDLEAEMPTGDEEPTEGFLAIVGEGDVVSSDYGPCDEPEYGFEIIEVDELQPARTTPTLPVPLPPTTVAQAEAWVRWAETEIGIGWHPDTPGDDLVTGGPIGLEARCACGETFCPSDLSDTIHIEREGGEPCGLSGVIVGTWGIPQPLFEGDVLTRYNEGLEAAHELLPDIYATASEIVREVYPDLLATTKGV